MGGREHSKIGISWYFTCRDGRCDLFKIQLHCIPAESVQVTTCTKLALAPPFLGNSWPLHKVASCPTKANPSRLGKYVVATSPHTLSSRLHFQYDVLFKWKSTFQPKFHFCLEFRHVLKEFIAFNQRFPPPLFAEVRSHRVGGGDAKSIQTETCRTASRSPGTDLTAVKFCRESKGCG